LAHHRRDRLLEHVYVLIRVKPGFEQKVGEALRKVKEAKEIHPLFGEYDFILKLEGKTHDDIAKTVLEKVRSNEGIATTKTLIKTSF
jgi:DNA-binding Lrp family transcriptional regulator